MVIKFVILEPCDQGNQFYLEKKLFCVDGHMIMIMKYEGKQPYTFYSDISP